MLALLTLYALSASGKPPKYDRWKNSVPYRASWGRYTIVINSKNPNNDGPFWLRILNRKHRVLREVRAWAITSVKQVPLLKGTPPELDISLWTGGAYASFTEVYFTQKRGLRNLLIFDGDSLGVKAVKDLNGDGIPEIITENPVLLDFSGYNFHRPWPVVTILGWNGTRYVDVTRRFPRRSLEQAERRKQDIIEAMQVSKTERRDWDFQDKISAYYANMLSIGRGTAARGWLRSHLPASNWRNLKANDRELRHLILTAAQHHAFVSQAKIIDQTNFQPVPKYKQSRN